jgi:hypothetical protein
MIFCGSRPGDLGEELFANQWRKDGRDVYFDFWIGFLLMGILGFLFTIWPELP